MAVGWLSDYLQKMQVHKWCYVPLKEKDWSKPLLYHGTSAYSIKKILKLGLLPSPEGKGHLGPRVYYADDYETALWYPMELDGPKQNQLLGEFLGTDALPMRAVFEAQCDALTTSRLSRRTRSSSLRRWLAPKL